MTVTYQVGGGGNLDIDFWVGVFALELNCSSDILRSLPIRTTWH